MKSIDIPTKFNIPWANNAGGSFIRAIPEASQIGIQDGAASLQTGYPPLNFSPVGAGGVPPFGQDSNGILNQTTAWSRWQSAGGPIVWDSAFSAAVGGYPLGAIVASATSGLLWLCLSDDNTTNPDAGGANWRLLQFAGGPATAVTGAALTYTFARVGFTVIRSNSGSPMADLLPGTASGTLAAGSVINVYNGESSALMTIGVESGATIKNSGSFVYLGPGQFASFLSDGTNYWPLVKPLRTRLAASTSLFVSSSGVDSNSGLTAALPFLTTQAAWDFAQANLDLNKRAITFLHATGTYTDAFSGGGLFVGQVNADSVIFLGNAVTPANILKSTSANAFAFNGGARARISGMRLTTTGGSGVVATGAGTDIYFNAMNFGAVGSHQVSVDQGATILADSNYAISGGGNSHVFCQSKSSFRTIGTNTITLSGTPNFSTAFNAVSELSFAEWANISFAGTGATGKRYQASLNSVIDTSGGGSGFLPGNAAGTTDTGAQYA